MRSRVPALVLLAALCGPLALTGCGDDGSSSSATELDTGDLETAAAGEGTACDYPTDDLIPVAKDVDKPPAEATVVGEVPVVLETTIGDIGLTLDADKAPCTVSSFLSLAQQGYYDDSPCHRLVTPSTGGIAVLQCGDPTGEGTGGPGYTVPDEVDGSETYPAGTLAMAKRADPDTGGSQFFLVYEDSQLPPEYTVFGTIDDAGVQAITDLAAQGVTDQGGFTGPAEPVDITAVQVG